VKGYGVMVLIKGANRAFSFLSLLLVVVLLSACGSEEDNGSDVESSAPRGRDALQELSDSNGNGNASGGEESAGSSTGNSVVLASLDEPEIGALSLPASDEVGGRLLFTQGDRLYISSFDGQEATLIADRVDPTTLSVSPDGQTIAYLQADGRRDYLMLTDLQTLETTQTVQVRGLGYGVAGWSPNREWMLAAIFNTSLSLTTVQPGNEAGIEVADQNPNFPFFWLEDNTLAVVPISDDVPQLVRFDPATGEQEVIDLDLVEVFSQLPQGNTAPPNPLLPLLFLDEALESTGLSIHAQANPYTNANGALSDMTAGIHYGVQAPRVLNGFNADAQICDVWSIQRPVEEGSTELEVVFENDSALTLTDLQWVADTQALYFLYWYYEDCQLENLTIELIRLESDGSIIMLTDAVYPGTSRSLSIPRVQNGQKYAISPDGQFIAWVGGGLDAGEASLNLLDIESEASVRVMAFQGTAGELQNALFENVFWISE
jgi:hypothetical protein